MSSMRTWASFKPRLLEGVKIHPPHVCSLPVEKPLTTLRIIEGPGLNLSLTQNPFQQLNGTFTAFVAAAANVANAMKAFIFRMWRLRVLIQVSSCGHLRLSPPTLIPGSVATAASLGELYLMVKNINLPANIAFQYNISNIATGSMIFKNLCDICLDLYTFFKINTLIFITDGSIVFNSIINFSLT